MNLFDEAREYLSKYEKARENFEGLEYLSMGINNLVEILEEDYADNFQARAKNMLRSYRNNTIKWVEDGLLVHKEYPSNLQFLRYCEPLLSLFVEINELLGSDVELDSMKNKIQTLYLSFVEQACKKGDFGSLIELVHGGSHD